MFTGVHSYPRPAILVKRVGGTRKDTMLSGLNDVVVCSILFSYCFVGTACLDYIGTPLAVPAIPKLADRNSHQGTLVSLNVQNDIEKKPNQDEHICNERDSIEIAVDQPIAVDVSPDYATGNDQLTEEKGSKNTGQGKSKDEQLNSIIKVYINGEKISEGQSDVGQLSTQSQIGTTYDLDQDSENPDRSPGVVNVFKRHKRSPAWIHSYSRQHGRHGRRTWKRYRDFWDWYLPYKNSFDPLASHIIG